MNTYGKSSGRNGNYSTNYQISGRELLTADEVRMLDNDYALLFIRGERPLIDKKYDLLKHPNVALTTDGKAKPYEHGKVTEAVAEISLAERGEEESRSADEGRSEASGARLWSEEELEELFQL